MANKESDDLSVQAKPPRVTRLNRRTIMFLSGLLLLIIILIMVSALSESNDNSSALPPSNVKAKNLGAKADTSNIQKLPAGYGDAAEIDKLLNRNQKPKVISQIPPGLKDELARMRKQQESLEQQLQKLRQHPAKAPARPEYNASDRQAMTSAIFVAGGAPRPEPQKRVTAQDGSKSNTKSTGNNASGHGDAYDKQNNQAGKASFLDSKPDKSIYSKHSVQYPASKFILQAGGVIPAVLQSEIVSNLPGMITAIVSRNVYDTITGQYLLIPKGSKLIGKYNSQISYGQDQLQAVFTRLIRPDGSSILLPSKSSGVNNMGSAGFSDEVNNHWGRIMGAAAMITLFNIPSIIATNQQNNSNWDAVGQTAIQRTSVGQNASTAALQSLGQSVSQIGNTLASRSMNIQPTITINAGYQFSIMIAKDVILPPYHVAMENLPEVGA